MVRVVLPGVVVRRVGVNPADGLVLAVLQKPDQLLLLLGQLLGLEAGLKWENKVVNKIPFKVSLSLVGSIIVLQLVIMKSKA